VAVGMGLRGPLQQPCKNHPPMPGGADRACPLIASAGAVSTRECIASTSSAHRVLRRTFYTRDRCGNNEFSRHKVPEVG